MEVVELLNRRVERERRARKEAEALLEQKSSELYEVNSRLLEINQQLEFQASELVRARDAALDASTVKGQFLANMSHEIRTPMNGVLGMAELVLATALTSEQRECLNYLKTSADSLLALIDDILDFSSIEAGKLTIDPIEMDLPAAIDAVMKTMSLRAHQKGIELACRVRPGVPGRIVVDPGRLRQIIVNLVGNAIKFTATGEVELQVAAGSRSDQDVELLFAVRDTGLGISKEKQQIVFGAFVQADQSTNRKYGGSGLGLAICSRLVELMGGRIWVDSAVGKGSTFHFTIRCPFVSGHSLSSAVNLPSGLSALVVDDNATSRGILEEVLGAWGMKMTALDSGQAALTRLGDAAEGAEPWSLILLDAHMPGIDGFAVADYIHKSSVDPGAVILMLNSADLAMGAAKYEALGIRACLVKPISLAELREAVLLAVGGGVRLRETPGESRGSPGSQTSRRLRVLLAEDNLVNQKVASRLLQRSGHTVVVAEDGIRALEALDTQSFDLVLMDLQMPRMGGWEATRAIRARERDSGKHLPVIALTAHAMKGDLERCLAEGMDDYISKPIRVAELLEKTNRISETLRVP